MSTILSYQIALKARDYPDKVNGLIGFLDPYIDEIDNARQGEASLLAAFGLYVAKTGLTANLPAGGFKITGLGTPVSAADAVTKAYADGLSFASALPDQTGSDGMVIRTDGGTASWGNWFGAPVALNGATTLIDRRTYHGDSSGGAFSVNLPALGTKSWIIIRDVARSCAQNPITLVPNGTDKVYGSVQNYIMDRAGETLMLVSDATKGWVRA